MILVTKTSDQTRQRVCVCVFFPFILDIKFVGRTSRGHTGFLIHLFSAVRDLIFLARRIQPFLSVFIKLHIAAPRYNFAFYSYFATSPLKIFFV